jgi:hypothetical protein
VISGRQVRDARNLLSWTARELARTANIRVFTIAQIEQATGLITYPGITAVEAVLKAQGINFFDGVVRLAITSE